ncbi:MAG: flagellar biosynthesis anti-sigma factor FlgM [Pirellulales bacterium]
MTWSAALESGQLRLLEDLIMHIHGPAHLHGAQPLNAPHRVTGVQTPVETSFASPTSYSTPTDTVEFSSEANLISQVHDLPDIRADRVAQIRAQIAAGAYETDEKLNTALDRLLDEFA